MVAMTDIKNIKIALIVPFFGKFPQYFNLFAFSLKFNPNVDVLLFTDQTVDLTIPNLIVKKCSFQDFKYKVQCKFDFSISLNTPYKVCDFRPAFGYIFEEELKGYTFWGHCDLDMIFGDVLVFLPWERLSEFDKIYQHGHLTLYRNTRENNMRFMLEGGMDYRNVFTSKIACIFDEVAGIQVKYDKLKIPTYKKRECADISPWHYCFQRSESYLSKDEKINFNYKYQLFFWQNGKIYRAYYHENKIRYDEFNYLHFQKRDLPIHFNVNDDLTAFFITRNGFIPKQFGFNVGLDDIKKYNNASLFGELKKRFQYKRFIWHRRWNKYLRHK